jgi:metal-responsive CopG/Arc/MetJ family transcriptional regulator
MSDGEPLDQRVQLVISKGQVREIDEWRRQQPDLPSRSEAIRRLIEAGLKASSARQRPSEH